MFPKMMEPICFPLRNNKKNASLCDLLKLPNVIIRKFENHYKTIEKFDQKNSILRVKSYRTAEEFTALRFEVEIEPNEIQKLFENFEMDKKVMRELDCSSLVKTVELFVDAKLLATNKVQVFRILEKCEYPLFISCNSERTEFLQKHVVKHFNENEIIRILLEMLVFFQKCEFAGKKPVLSNLMICYCDDRYKMVINEFEKTEKQNSNKSSFENTKTAKTTKPIFDNKLEIEKASLKTNDTLENEEETETQEKKTVSFDFGELYHFAAKVCGGLFKDMAVAFFGIGLNNQESFYSILTREKFSKFGNLLEILECIEKSEISKINYQEVDKWILKMQNWLQIYFESFFSFKNQDVFLLNQPIFCDIKRLRLELSHDNSNTRQLVGFMSKELMRMSEVRSLDMCFNDCLLSSSEIALLLEPVNKMSHLQRLVLKLCHNNIERVFLDSIRGITFAENLETFDLSLCESAKQDQLQRGMDRTLVRLPPQHSNRQTHQVRSRVDESHVR